MNLNTIISKNEEKNSNSSRSQERDSSCNIFVLKA